MLPPTNLSRRSMRILLGWGLSAVWLVMVGWGFWQTELRPLQQRFASSAATRQQIDQLEHWFRVTSATRIPAAPTLILDASARCPCATDSIAMTEDWTDLEAQGLHVLKRAELRVNPLPGAAHAALTLFSAQGKLLYAGPASLGASCGQLSLAAVLAQGLRIDQAPFGTPIVADHCECHPRKT
jgi:hypothetical protein